MSMTGIILFFIVILLDIFLEEVQNILSLKRIAIVNTTCLQHCSSKGKKEIIND